MCYQKSLLKSESNLTRYMDIPPIESEIYTPYYLNDGFAHDKVYIIPQEEPEYWFPANWGLVPDYFQGSPEEFYKQGKYNTLNARDDKVFSSNVYKRPIIEGRCLVFCDGFFEPHHYGKESQPYYCFINEGNETKDNELFTFAGIYTSDGEGSFYVSLITVDANPKFEKIHNKAKRMPLVLDRKFEKEWLADNQNEKIIKGIMKEGFTSKSFSAYPVMNYHLKNNRELKNTEEVLKPVEPLDRNLSL